MLIRPACLLFLGAALAACGGGSGTTTVTALPTAGEDGAAATVTVTVAPPVVSSAATNPDDTVTLVDSGFGLRDDRQLGIGLLVRDDSPRHAHDVAVQVNILDAADDILATDSGTIAIVPSGQTVAYGTDVVLPEKGKPVKLEVTMTPGAFTDESSPAPAITRVRLVDDQFVGLSVTGEVHNTTAQPIDSFQRINVVLVDADGKVSGGGYAYLGGNLAPNGRAAFRAINGVDVTPAADAAKAIVTLDQRAF